MNEEIWKNIVGYEGLYEVSTSGRVRSLKFGKTKVLKPAKEGNGYLIVSLCKDGEKKMFSVHRLVAKAFIPNPMHKPHVNHRNEVKTDNRVENLEWMTHKENQNYGTRNERSARARINNPKISKPVLQLAKDGKIVAEYPSTHEAERQTGIDSRHISKCCKGEYKTSGGYVWKYA